VKRVAAYSLTRTSSWDGRWQGSGCDLILRTAPVTGKNFIDEKLKAEQIRETLAPAQF
jgi:hypothetical protein